MQKFKKTLSETFHAIVLYKEDYYSIVGLMESLQGDVPSIRIDEFELESPAEIENINKKRVDFLCIGCDELLFQMEDNKVSVSIFDSDDAATYGTFHKITTLLRDRQRLSVLLFSSFISALSISGSRLSVNSPSYIEMVNRYERKNFWERNSDVLAVEVIKLLLAALLSGTIGFFSGIYYANQQNKNLNPKQPPTPLSHSQYLISSQKPLK